MHSLYLTCLLAGVATAKSAYMPTKAACPSTAPLVRDGNTDLSTGEAAYIAGRKPVADAALRSWLDKQSAGLGTNATSLPTIALSSSGGGWRALTVGAGVMQAMDGRETGNTAVSTSGLLQAMSYHIGVSGGAWLVSSWAGNNFPTISSLKKDLWLSALDHGLEFPNGYKFLVSYGIIAGDIVDKIQAGYPVSMTDLWSRLLSYQLLPGSNGGAAVRMSDLKGYSNMVNFNAPIPIVNMNSVDTAAGQCNPLDNGTVWEANPFEFGSWDDHVSAWIPIENMGTAADASQCTTGFDNLGFILGQSSNLFALNACVADDPFANIRKIVDNLTEFLHDWSEDTLFGRVPNPFKGFNGTGDETAEVFAVDELYMVDGGIMTHNDPIAPLLEPARDVSVIFLNDNSADSVDNFPTGQGLEDVRNYLQNITRINSRMPTIPDTEVFAAKGLNKRGTFFGCYEPETVTIIYLPNVNYTFESNQPTNKFQYDNDVTEGLIGNGMAIATQDGAEGWGLCVACAIMMKENVTLPAGCDACFDQWCYR